MSGRRAYTVLAASAVVYFMAFIPYRISPIIFVACIERFEVSRAAAVFPITLFSCLRTVTGPLVAYIGEKIGIKATTAIGCAIGGLGFAACFFAENILFITISLGVICGFGAGMGVCLIHHALKSHFETNYTFACGISLNGVVFATFLMPPIADLLLKHYGVSGMFLVIGAIMLNGVPASLLVEEKAPERKTLNEKQNDIYTINDSKSFQQHNNLSLSHEKEDTIVKRSKDNNQSFFYKITTWIKILDPPFIIICIAMSSSIYVFVVVFTVLIDVSREKGLPVEYEVYLVSFSPIMELVGNSVLGLIPDRGYMSKTNFAITCFLGYGASCAILLWSAAFAVYFIGIQFNLFFSKGIHMIYPGLIYEFIQKDNQARAQASKFMLYGVLCFTTSPLIGYFRDHMGSYSGVLYAQIAICLFCALLTSLLPWVSNSNKK